MWRQRPDLFRYLREDLAAGIVTFLIALPLCLGIAHASGAPLEAGIITGIVAGLLVTWLSGGERGISGPAAGLTVIVAQSLDQIGSYPAFLSAVVLAGLIQIIFGILKTGAISAFVPAAVIRGMLAAIGLILNGIKKNLNTSNARMVNKITNSLKPEEKLYLYVK